MIDKSKYFWCYSSSMSKFISSKNIDYITLARHPKSNKLFSLYEYSWQLQRAIDEFNNLNK